MNQLDYVISYFFQLHLILHACVQTFDVTFLGVKFWDLGLDHEKVWVWYCSMFHYYLTINV